eukprot:GFUD01013576.1.p1 GENE.GFUD01013576.1~~GFUD01013576.1.p1  ORF type:complete len:107 (-),score=20.83 GFUD01013576.1:336-656(-)
MTKQSILSILLCLSMVDCMPQYQYQGVTLPATSTTSATTTSNIGQLLGEPCGGFWYNHGACAQGLTCQKLSGWSDTPGECVEEEDYVNNYDDYFDYLDWSQRPIGN